MGVPSVKGCKQHVQSDIALVGSSEMEWACLLNLNSELHGVLEETRRVCIRMLDVYYVCRRVPFGTREPY